MCFFSSPSVPAQTKTEAPTNFVEMDAAESSVASRDSERQRRLRALSRLQTMNGGAMQGAQNTSGKMKLGA